jgi:hypothetical protein
VTDMAWAAAMSITMLLCCCCCNTAALRPSAPATRGLSLLSCSSTGRGSDRPPRGRSLNSTPARASVLLQQWSGRSTPARVPRFSHDRGRFAQHSHARPGSPTTVVWSLNTRARAPRFSHDSAPPMTGYLKGQLRRRCLRRIAFCC